MRRSANPVVVLMRNYYFEWRLEDSRALLDLIEENPMAVRSKGGRKFLARHFPGKSPADVARHVSMVQLAAIFMGALNLDPKEPSQARFACDKCGACDRAAASSDGGSLPSTSKPTPSKPGSRRKRRGSKN